MMFIMGILAMPIVFWSFVIFCILWSLAATDKESASSAFFSYLFIAIAVAFSFGPTSVLGFIKANAGLIAASFPIYFIIGALWATFVKWKNFCRATAGKINEKISDMGKDAAAECLSDYTQFTKQDVLNSNFRCLAPSASKNKERICTWIGFWPSSVIWFLIHEPVEYVFNYIKNLLQNISQRIFEKEFSVN